MKSIVYQNAKCLSICTPSGELPIEEVIKKDIPQNVPYMIVENNIFPVDDIFYNAWEANFTEKTITENLEKSRVIAHEVRRSLRDEEFAPYDAIIAKQIPGETKAAEKARVEIRAKYEAMQIALDEAKTVEDLRALLVAQ
jgi:hypothetical protein